MTDRYKKALDDLIIILLDALTNIIYLGGMLFIELFLRPRLGGQDGPLLAYLALTLMEVTILLALVRKLFRSVEAFLQQVYFTRKKQLPSSPEDVTIQPLQITARRDGVVSLAIKNFLRDIAWAIVSIATTTVAGTVMYIYQVSILGIEPTAVALSAMLAVATLFILARHFWNSKYLRADVERTPHLQAVHGHKTPSVAVAGSINIITNVGVPLVIGTANLYLMFLIISAALVRILSL